MQTTSGNAGIKNVTGLMLLLAFIIVMVSLIVFLFQSTPNKQSVVLFRYADQMGASATNAHWQWEAESKPGMILFVHYNDDGKEVARSPVTMDYQGWPRVEPSAQGCNTLWRMLINKPMRIEGFRVLSEFYNGEDEDADDAFCRFRLSAGNHFDYNINEGTVTYTR